MGTKVNSLLARDGGLVEITRGWQVSRKSIHTGVDIPISEVHSICQGVVIHIGENLYESGYWVTVQYDTNRCVRYGHLKSTSVKLSQILYAGDTIGYADKFLHFEYLQTYPSLEGSIPVRVQAVTYYKHDPTEIVSKAITRLPDSNRSKIKVSSWDNVKDVDLLPDTKQELTEGVDKEWYFRHWCPPRA